VFQSRWGVHPCSYETYRKLKLLNHLYLRAVRLAHAWGRWKRKDPHNRVVRRRIRDSEGKIVGYEPPVPLPEPKVCLVFSRPEFVKRHLDKKGDFVREGFMDERVVTDDFGIIADYASARRPAAEPAQIQPLRLNAAEIDALFEKARCWLAEQDVK
jgi:hypothetical protein